jgi:hypothetical protein
LLFLNVLPGYEPIAHEALLQLWFAVNALYFVAGFVILTAGYRGAEDKGERRRIGALWVAVAIFGVVFVHNVVARNWTNWFAIPLPTMFSPAALLVVDVVFLFAPLAMAYFVLTEGRDIGKVSTHGAEVTCARRIHKITRQSASGTARDSASASDRRRTLSATQVRPNLAGGLVTPRASGAH